MNAKKLLTRLGIFFFSVFVILYILIQLVSTLTSDVVYQYAVAQDTDITVESVGYLVKNEKILYAAQSGVLTYSVREAQKLGTNQLVATVFADSAGVAIQNRIDQINKKIEILKSSSVETNYLITDISKIDSKIYQYLIDSRICMENNDLYMINQNKESLLQNLNKRQLITTNASNFDAQIASLEAEKKQLTSTLKNPLCSVYTPTPGFFSTLLDGYELNFTPAAVENLTVDSFHELISLSPADYGSYAIGKISTDFHWYTLCEVSQKDAADFLVGLKYPLSFLYSPHHEIRARLDKIVTQTDRDTAVLVFSVEEFPQDFGYTRQQTVRVTKETVKGIEIPRSALRMADGVQGVFVVTGSVVDFKRVEIIHSTESKYICLEKESTDPNYKLYLSRYDRIITEGKDLYVGKILD